MLLICQYQPLIAERYCGSPVRIFLMKTAHGRLRNLTHGDRCQQNGVCADSAVQIFHPCHHRLIELIELGRNTPDFFQIRRFLLKRLPQFLIQNPVCQQLVLHTVHKHRGPKARLIKSALQRYGFPVLCRTDTGRAFLILMIGNLCIAQKIDGTQYDKKYRAENQSRPGDGVHDSRRIASPPDPQKLQAVILVNLRGIL